LWRSFLLITHIDWFRRVYFSFDTRADELLVGCALALWQPKKSTIQLICRLWPAAALFFVAFMFKIGVRSSVETYVYIAGLPIITLASGCLLIAASQTQNVLSAFLELSPVVALGRISYGFYLWHYPILRLPHQTFTTAFCLTLLAATSSY